MLDRVPAHQRAQGRRRLMQRRTFRDCFARWDARHADPRLRRPPGNRQMVHAARRAPDVDSPFVQLQHSRPMTTRSSAALLTLLCFLPPLVPEAAAAVTHVDVTARGDLLGGKPFGSVGSYEKI